MEKLELNDEVLNAQLDRASSFLSVRSHRLHGVE